MSQVINPLSETFSSILYNVSDFEKQLNNITDILTSAMDDIDRKNLLSIDFLDVYKQYPRYPYDYKVINSLNKYNLVTIYNIVQNDIEYLLDAITDQNILNQKIIMDRLPDNYILSDYNLQTAFFANLTSDYFEPSFFSGFSFDKERRSYLYKTFGYYINSDIKETSLIYIYVLYIFLVRNLRYTLKIFENIYLTSAEAFRDNSAFVDSFNE